MADIQTSEVDAKFELVNEEPQHFFILINLKKINNFKNTNFVKNEKYKCGVQVKVKIYIVLRR
jgi:hypothetical protein